MSRIRRLRYHVRRTVIVTIAIAAITAACGFGGYVSARTSAPTCPANYHCVYQPQMIIDEFRGKPGHSEWMVTDGYGAPMAWVSLYGMYSGGLGDPNQGGNICVTYSVWYSIACLTPTGTLILRKTGPNGPVGPPETLTPGDIAWIHRHGG